MDKLRSISVVVIARNEEENILQCLKSLAAQDFPRELFEVLLVDNGSTDSTSKIANDFVKSFQNLRVVENPLPGIARTRNVGIRATKFNTVAFMDADCEATVSWLSVLAKAFDEEIEKDSNVAAIGGPNVMPEDTTLFRRVVAVVVTNYWGNHGSVQGKTYDRRSEVDHLPTLNVMYDKNRIVEVGMFDEKQGNISEDVDMSHRLRGKGYKLLYEPKAIIFHRWRENLLGWIRNMEVYGKGRSWLMKKDPCHIKPKFAAPILLLIACLLMVASLFCFQTTVSWWICCLLAFPFLTYCTLTLLMSFYACFSNGKPHYLPAVFFVYAITHLSYGAGQIHGLFTRRGSDTGH